MHIHAGILIISFLKMKRMCLTDRVKDAIMRFVVIHIHGPLAQLVRASGS